MTKMTPEVEGHLISEARKSVKQKVIGLWYGLPSKKRKDCVDVLVFFQEHVQNKSYLLGAIPSHKYQTVQIWLSKHLEKL